MVSHMPVLNPKCSKTDDWFYLCISKGLLKNSSLYRIPKIWPNNQTSIFILFFILSCSDYKFSAPVTYIIILISRYNSCIFLSVTFNITTFLTCNGSFFAITIANCLKMEVKRLKEQSTTIMAVNILNESNVRT